MSLPISIAKTSEPLDGLLILTRAAIGLGVGMLMADKIKRPVRQAAAIVLVSVGALGFIATLGFMAALGFVGTKGFMAAAGFMGTKGFMAAAGFMGTKGFMAAPAALAPLEE